MAAPILLLLRCAGLVICSGVVPVTEQDFAETLRSHGTSALVAFISPWCLECRRVPAELARVQTSLSTEGRGKPGTGTFVGQVDVSKDPALAARYRVQRSPAAVFFPDTRALAPGLQTIYEGQLVYRDLLAFAHEALAAAPAALRALSELRFAAASATEANGVFLGFFRSPGDESELQDLWATPCLRRHPRALVFAQAPSLVQELAAGEGLWEFAGLPWKQHGAASDEAILFLPPKPSGQPPANLSGLERFSLQTAPVGEDWRSRLDRFCAWVERQSLGDVAVLDPQRAAAIDHTYEWLMLLFADEAVSPDGNSTGKELREHFEPTLKRLRTFISEARSLDSRFSELMPLIIPGGTEMDAFRIDFGIAFPDEQVEAEWSLHAGRLKMSDILWEGDVNDLAICQTRCDSDASCTAISYLDGRTSPNNYCHTHSSVASATRSNAEDPWNFYTKATVLTTTTTKESNNSEVCPVGRWPVALFNTRTRRKFRYSGFWCPDQDYIGLLNFANEALDGVLSPFCKSQTAPVAAAAVGAPQGVSEIIGHTFSKEVVEPVLAGNASVLLFVYVPWCGHSLHFVPLWHRLSAALQKSPQNQTLEALSTAPQGELRLAQLDGSQNEHPELPSLDTFPAVLLLSRSGNTPRPTGNTMLGSESSSTLRVLRYDGVASVKALQAWVAEHTLFSTLSAQQSSA